MPAETKVGTPTPNKYSVPILYQDLPPTEALGQIFDSLKHLQQLCDRVFTNVSNRVAEEKGKLSNLNSRIDTCKTLIKQVQDNPTKATTVYSSTKYPAPERMPDFTRLHFVDQDDTMRSVPSQVRPVATAERMTGSKIVNTQDLFANLSGALDKQDMGHQEGLGRLPGYLPSVSSILLFNSSENPYKTYVSLDNLEGIGGTDREKNVEELAAAPTTLIEGTILPMFAAPQLAYQPDLDPGDVPTFDLPANLPLGQLADIRFDTEQQASIAPSFAQLPALPSVEDFQVSSKKQPKGSSVPAPPANTPAPPANVPAPPAAPANVPAPPPTAPVPPPAAAPRAPAAPAPAAAPKVDGGRGDLLASIRNRKAVKLRKVTDKGKSPRKKKEEEAASGGGGGGGDMMSALKNILAMRRKVTSGKSDQEEKRGGGKVAVPSLSDGDDDDDKEFADEEWD